MDTVSIIDFPEVPMPDAPEAAPAAKTTLPLVVYTPKREEIAALKEECGLKIVTDDKGKQTATVALDASTTAGYKLVQTKRAQCRTWRGQLEKDRTAANAEALKHQRAVNALAKEIEADILSLEEPLAAEMKRIDDEKDRIAKEKAEAVEKAQREKLEAEAAERRAKEKAERDAEETRLAEERKKLEAERAKIAEERRLMEERQRIENERIAAERAKVEAEQAEAKRIAEEEAAAKREKIERLAAESRAADEKRFAEERARLDEERAKIDADRKRQEAERLELERLKFEAEAKERAEKEAAERAERLRVENERMQKQQAELQAAAEKERQAKLADRERVMEWIEKVKAATGEVPTKFKSKSVSNAVNLACVEFGRVAGELVKVVSPEEKP
jgi:chromosome segregation ATPase